MLVVLVPTVSLLLSHILGKAGTCRPCPGVCFFGLFLPPAGLALGPRSASLVARVDYCLRRFFVFSSRYFSGPVSCGWITTGRGGDWTGGAEGSGICWLVGMMVLA